MQPSVEILAPPSLDILTSLPLTLQCQVTVSAVGSPSVVVQWRKDGTVLGNSSRVAVTMVVSPGVFRASLSIQSLRLEDEGSYSCTATANVEEDGFQSVNSGNAALQLAIEREEEYYCRAEVIPLIRTFWLIPKVYLFNWKGNCSNL